MLYDIATPTPTLHLHPTSESLTDPEGLQTESISPSQAPPHHMRL